LERLERGEIDLLVAIAYSAERDERLDFTSETILSNWGQVYTQKNAGIQSVLDLEGRTIAVLKGDIYYTGFRDIVEHFDIDCDFVAVDEYAAVFELVDEGKVDAGLMTRLYGLQHERDYAVDQSPILCCPVELRFAVPEGRNQDLVNALDRRLAALKGDQGSVYYQSLNRWFGGISEPEISPWLKWALALAGGLLLFFLGASVILRAQVRARTRALEEEVAEHKQAEEELRQYRHHLEELVRERTAELEAANERLGQEVAERVQTEETLRESERDKALILSSVSELVTYQDRELKIIWANRAAGESVSLPASELLDRHCYEIWHQRNEPCVGCPVAKSLETGDFQEGEATTPDGRVWAVRGYPVRGENGNVAGAVEVTREISVQKRAEEALRESEARYHSLFEDSPISLWEEDFSEVKRIIDGLRDLGVSDFRTYFEGHPEAVVRCAGMVKILDVNQSTLHLFKARGKDELCGGLGKTFDDESFGVFREELIALAEGRCRFETEASQQSLTGDKMYIALSLAVAPGYEETWSKVFVSIVDIAERKRMEEALQQRTMQLSTLNEIGRVVSTLLDVRGALGAIFQQVQRCLPLDAFYVCLYDAETNWISYPLVYDGGDYYQGDEVYLAPGSYVSRTIKTATSFLINRSAKELAAMPRPPRPVGDASKVSASLLFAPLQVGQQVIGAISAQSYSPNAYNDEHLALLVGVASQAAIAIENARLYDQVRRHAVELEQRVIERTAELRDAQTELVRRERLSALGQLTATVAHEIRNPLGTIRTAVFAIGDAIERHQMGRVERALQLAERNVVRCDTIISELLDYTRDRVLQLKSVNVDTWLEGVLDEQTIPEGIVCTRELSAGIEVPIDGEHLRRAVINVVNNAIDALQDEEAPGNRLTMSTHVVGDRAGSRLEIRVSDTGCGIAPGVLDKIFEPLFSTKSYGVGLGLPIVKNIMEQHGGGVDVQSELGKGTTVVLWLPVSN
jgi:signal transduction histidine kinase